MATLTDEREWWKEAVVYEVYPRSFNDTDGDGVGDIPGITAKADYFADLGVDVVWVCPVYDSPDADNGYDIRDYRAIHDDFGTMADFEALLEALHERDIALITDQVVNHTSDEHEWFCRSRRREDGYEEFYHWVEGRPDEPPNNWESIFGGSAWSFDDEREAWYLHLFHEKQPDLNWRRPAVRDAVSEMLEWWLEKGLDGFRLDALNLLSKPDGYPDGDPDEPLCGREHFFNGPRIHEYLRELHETVFAGRDAVTVAEMGGIGPEHVADYCGADGDGLDMVFQFLHEDLEAGPQGEWSLPRLKEIVAEWQGLEDGWVAPCLGNHDRPRSVSWWGEETHREASATLLATFLLTLRGTPHVYQGEELGMTNRTFDGLEKIDDPETISRVRSAIESGEADSFADLRDEINRTSRDHARTPMQWSAAPNAGFTAGEPWLGVHEEYPTVNVAAARADESSVWHHYRELIELRHREPVLVEGTYEPLALEHERLFPYVRTLDDEAVLVVLNWATEPTALEELDVSMAHAGPVVWNYERPPSERSGDQFRPYEAVVYRLE